MQEDLQKVDIIRDRLQIGYKEAYEALEQSNGDVVQALISAENHKHEDFYWVERINVWSHELIDRVESIIKAGNVTSISLSRNGKTFITIPVTVGAGMAVLFPYMTLLLMMGAMASKFEMAIERKTKGKRYARPTH